MKTSAAGRKLIEQREGVRLTAYLDSKGIWTIGVGHAATSGVEPIPRRGMRITAEQADEIFAKDLERYEAAVSMVKVPLTQNQFDALVSFTYNVGGVHLADSTLLKMLNKGDYAGASEQFGRWAKAGGKTLPGLVARRESEKELFNTKA